MMKQIRYIIPVILLSLFTTSNFVAAQENDDSVKSLEEILNLKTKENLSSISPEERRKIYFKKCMAIKSLAFDREEREILCSCTASKVSDTLTGQEFEELYKNTKIGREARMRIIAFAYTDCMRYAIKTKIYKDCRVLPIMRRIMQDKRKVCECVADHYERNLNEGAAHIIMEGVKYDPMALNPLEHHFTTDAYYNTLKQIGKVCRAKVIYYQNN